MGKVLSDINFDDKAFFKEFAKTTIDLSLAGVNSFLEALSIEFSDKINGEGSFIEQANKIESYNDIKKTTYYNIKSLHEMMSGIVTLDSAGINLDNYISNPNAISKIQINTLEELNLFSQSTPDCDAPGSTKSYYDLYQIFQVVDRGNNDIGNRVLANLGTLYRNLHADFTKESITSSSNDPKNQEKQIDTLTKTSVNNLFSSLASESGFLYQQIPNYLNVNGSLPEAKTDEDITEIVDHMFGVHTDTSLFGDTFLQNRNVKFGGPTGLPGVIFQLGTITSSADDGEKGKLNDYTNSFCLDLTLDNNNEVTVLNENIPDDVLNSYVTSFVVDFGKQNQQMFKSIQLDTAQFYDTEESIKSWVNLVNDTGTGLQTTNIFPILEKRSYTCNVVGLGNATIQPLSYFYLRNVPLFHGTYWITNVSHKLSPNTMITEFKGVRQPIATKGDTRKALLRLLKEKIKDIQDANKVANKVQTEGLRDTSGVIKLITSSDKPYKDFVQAVAVGSGYEQMDGKNILGSYIYSITQDNKMTAANYGLISYLFNISSVYLNNSQNPTEILPGMVKIAIGNMKKAALTKDVRYTDNNSLSLSYLLKNVGQNFLPSGEMGEYLDNLTELSYIQRNHNLPKSTKIWDIQGYTSTPGTFVKGDVAVSFKSTKPLNTSSDSIDISGVNMFIDPKEVRKSSDVFLATNYRQNVFDIFNAFDPTNKIIDKVNTELTIKVTEEIESVSTITQGKPDTYDNVKGYIGGWQRFFINDGKDITGDQLISLKTFALYISDGNKTDDDLYNFMIKRHQNDIGANNAAKWLGIINDIKVAKPSGSNNYPKAIFYNLGSFDGYSPNTSDVNSVTDPTGYNDTKFLISATGVTPSDFSYDFDATTDSGSLENWNKFINDDVKRVYNQRNTEYDKKLAELQQNPASLDIKVKFLGAYGYGSGETTDNVAFFKTNANLTFSAEDRKNYDLEGATSADVILTDTTSNENGVNRTTFLSRLVQVTKSEQDKWRENGTLLKECDGTPKVNELLNNYWGAVGSTLEKKGGCNVAWSAAFISYVVKNAGAIEFPYSATHATYIVKARDNKNSGGAYSWYGYDALTKEATVEAGDLVCYTNGKNINTKWDEIQSGESYTPCHCDVVVSIDNQGKANTIGGNVSNTAGGDSLQLNDDKTINLNADISKGVYRNSSSPKIYRGVLKYQPAETATATATANTNTTGKVLPFNGDITALATAAGYDPNSPEAIMAAAIAKKEGWTNKKTLAYTNNNPGNLDYSSEYKKYDPSVYKQNGNTKQTSRFAVFSKAEYGFKALIESKIKSWADGRMPPTETNGGKYASKIGTWSKNQPPTFLQFFYTYAPPTDSNDPDQYAADVVTTINTNAKKSFTVQTKVKDIFG
jgi:hypothetical protein